MTGDGEPHVPVGYVRRAHGLDGAVLVTVLTDAPDLRYTVGARFVTAGDPPHVLTISSVRSHREGLLVGFETIADRDAAGELRGELLTIPRSERRSLEGDEYWEDELVGLEVVDLGGAVMGTLTGVVPGPAQDRLAVETDAGGTVEVPFVHAIVKEVLVGEGRVVVDPPEGLF